MRPISFSSSTLKLIACATMLVDHMGILLFPEQPLLRLVGRISFPLFAFLIAEGYQRTSNVRSYLFRLLGFAVISQIPYSLFLYTAGETFTTLNIFFTLSAGLIALILMHNLRPAYALSGVVLLFVFAEFFSFDYGMYGILTILGSALLLRSRAGGATLLSLLPTFYTVTKFLRDLMTLQIFATLSVPLVMLYNGERGRHLPRWFFYSFYPAHLLILTLVWYVLNYLK